MTPTYRRGSIPNNRYHSDPPRRRWVPDTAAANAMPEPVPEPDPARRLRLIVGELVGPALYDYRKGQTSYASAGDFCAAVVEDVQKYAVEMGLNAEAAEAEARRQLEEYNV